LHREISITQCLHGVRMRHAGHWPARQVHLGNRTRRLASVAPDMSQAQPRATQQTLDNVIGHKWNGRLLFSLCKRFSDLAGVLDEKLRDWAERAVL
jgi:hypothetical protein